MKFKLDENMPIELAAILSDRGHDTATVSGEGLTGADDAELFRMCQCERRALITLDSGFGDIRRYPPERSAGLLVLKLNRHGKSHVLSVLKLLPDLLEKEKLESRLWIVEEDRVKIREGRKE